MSPKNETLLLTLSLLLTLGILGGGYWFIKKQFFSDPQTSLFNKNSQYPVSLGNALLFSQETTPQKKAGIEAFAQGNYAEAVNHFQNSLNIQRNDPETLIYRNNAEAADHNPLKIAVVVPIGKNENIAKEILRGVAQAQTQLNQANGINGRYLQVAIVNDNNDPVVAQQVARQLVQDSSILAVIGHNSSDATLGATPEYEQGGLVMISPTSNADKIATEGDYIFRTIPSVRFEADALSRYAINQAKKTKLMVCFDSQAQYSQSFNVDFTSAFLTDGGQLINVTCDLSANNFNALNIVNQAKQQGAEGIVLIPSVSRLPAAIAVAQANQQQLALFGSSALYTFETLEKGQSSVSGMVLPVPWHPAAFSGNAFPQEAIQLWGGEVNWRSALAYDATQVITTALSQGNPTRQGIQQALANPNFSSEGATGAIRFLPSGDRNSAPIFVKIARESRSKSNTGFDFVPLSR